MMIPAIEDPVERALAYVAQFKGDGRCSLNCFHAEALAAEVHRLRAFRMATSDLIGVCQALLWLNPTLPERAVQMVEDAIASAQRAKDAA